MQKKHSFATHFATHFLRKSGKQYTLEHTQENRSLIGKGVRLYPLVCFRETHKGFQKIDSSTNKGNNSAIKYRHFTDTFVCSLNVLLAFKIEKRRSIIPNPSSTFCPHHNNYCDKTAKDKQKYKKCNYVNYNRKKLSKSLFNKFCKNKIIFFRKKIGDFYTIFFSKYVEKSANGDNKIINRNHIKIILKNKIPKRCISKVVSLNSSIKFYSKTSDFLILFFLNL